MKRILFITLCAAVLLYFAACGKNKIDLPDDDPYNLMSYKSDSMFDIEQVDSTSYDKNCVTYSFRYKSEPTVTVIGYISIPYSCIENRQSCKCLIYNRGGNSRYGYLNDSTTAELCSQLDRIVIASQYRGSEGCTGYDEFGGRDLNDVIKLIDLCEQFEFADMSDLCVMGVSRGGMMSYLTASEDERVEKVISVSGVADLCQSYYEREDMKNILRNSIGGTPEQLPEEYRKRSAVSRTEEINVPVLIIHSVNDDKVSFSQAENLAEKLSADNKICYFKEYSDDIHGFHSDDISLIKKFINNDDISEYLY